MQYLCKKKCVMNKILGLGNALVDVLVRLDNDGLLEELELPKGGMTLIDEAGLQKVSNSLNYMKTHLATGGSAGNVIRTLACLGAKTGFIGKVGYDTYGDFFRDSLVAHCTEANLLVSPVLPSGVASTFISPDGERTFATYLGAAAALRAAELRAEMFAGYDWLFIEGYLVQDHNLIVRALDLARKAGLKVCLDMASYNVVASDRIFFTSLIRKYVDIIFANEDEALALTGQSPEDAAAAIAGMCDIAVVKVGSRGSYVYCGEKKLHIDAIPVPQVIDTTGAGDYFAGGFLYGLCNGRAVEECAKIGAVVSSHVIQVVGTELTKGQWTEIKEDIS